MTSKNMSLSSHHTDKRIFVLLLLIVVLLLGMYVVSLNKLTTSSKAAYYDLADDVVCQSKLNNKSAYCKMKFAFCGNGYRGTSFSCRKGMFAGNCCVPKAASAPPTSAPGTTDTDCGIEHIDCKMSRGTPKCVNVILNKLSIYVCVPLNFGSPTPNGIPEA